MTRRTQRRRLHHWAVASVGFVAQENSVAAWRTNTAGKSHDPDGDNVYGTAGYVLYAVDSPPGANGDGVAFPVDPLSYDNGTFRTISSVPSFLTLGNVTQNAVAFGFSYPVIDDPREAPSGLVANLETGLGGNDSVSLGTEASLIRLTVGAGFPSTGVRVGVMVSGDADLVSNVRIVQTVGSGSDSVSANVNGGPDVAILFFDIEGASPGDEFEIHMTKTGGGNANLLYAGLCFDEIP